MTERALAGRDASAGKALPGTASRRHTSSDNQALLRKQQNRHLPRMMHLCASAHPYYRRVFRDLGLAVDDFHSVEDLRRLPILRKQDYVRDPEQFRLRLDGITGLALEEATLADVIYTSGSSGKPTPFYDTVHDRFARIHHLGRVAAIAGIGPRDTVMNLFPLSAVPHQGFLSAMWGAMAAGSRLLSGMTGSAYADYPIHHRMDDAIEMIEREQATVLWGITAYVRRVVIRAQELGKDFSAVRLAMVMGEPCPPPMREDFRQRLQSLGSTAPKINNGYGFTEVQGPAIECVEGGGRHQVVPDQFYTEIVDPDTGSPVPEGKPGLLLISHLNRRGTVLLRYAPGDVVAMSHETCLPCGRREPRLLGNPHRVDGLTKVKGTLIDPAALHEQLAQLLHQGVAEYQVTVTREILRDPFSQDVLLVRVACAESARKRLAEEVPRLVRQAAEVTPSVEFLPEDGFAEIAGGYKFSRFADERKTVSLPAAPHAPTEPLGTRDHDE